MTRWIAGAVLAAGSLLLCPLEATAQNYESNVYNATLICGYLPGFSFVVIESRSPKKRADCRWKCFYSVAGSAVTVMNSGARTLRPGQRVGMEATKKVAPGITGRVTGTGSCR